MDTFKQFENTLIDFLAEDPNQALSLGLAYKLNELPDPSRHYGLTKANKAKDLLTQLKKIKEKTTDFDQRVDLDLAELTLKSCIHCYERRINGDIEFVQKPTAGADICEGIFTLFVDDPRSPAERLDNINVRLSHVPEFLDAMVQRLTIPVTRWRQVDLEMVDSLPTLFSAIEVWAVEHEYADLHRLQQNLRTAAEALEGYKDKLEALETTDQFALSVDDAEQVVKNRGINLSFDELHKIAVDFLKETRQQIASLTVKLNQKYQLPEDSTSEQLHDFLNKRFQVNLQGQSVDKVIDFYREESAKIIKFIDERKLFPIFDDQQMLIEQTPKFLEPVIPAGAMRSPLPLREGTRTSLIHLTLRDDLLDEHTLLGIPVMMIHEGIPGHHLQLATSTTHSRKMRRIMFTGDQAEGWTTMLEDYMLDIGYMGELTDEARFIAKHDICRIGARVAIDLFFMTGDKKYLDVGIPLSYQGEDVFAMAGELLQKVTGFTSGRVQAELNWYSMERGYPLSYLTGNKLVWALKEAFVNKHQHLDSTLHIDQAFHEAFLSVGNMPVSFMEKVFKHQGWV
ncbi:DUF885 family protein [Zooshikella harenae]|uniref:DUF885 family protein n=1 Tax=Zooshikella harenae TaxID=2827238 RepID=A0ABS5ZGZ6_9GAMM|nr:DUF885 family protein [Zooshikella harenae]MBU2713143.1 DUF885 family protein [Zooshikella harenae]